MPISPPPSIPSFFLPFYGACHFSRCLSYIAMALRSLCAVPPVGLLWGATASWLDLFTDYLYAVWCLHNVCCIYRDRSNTHTRTNAAHGNTGYQCTQQIVRLQNTRMKKNRVSSVLFGFPRACASNTDCPMRPVLLILSVSSPCVCSVLTHTYVCVEKPKKS